MGIVSDSDLELEIKKNGAKEGLYPEVKIPVPAGRKEGDRNVPPSLQKVIAQDAIENGRQSATELARSFGISPASVSAYTNGATSTASYNQPNQELKGHVNKVKQKIAGKARRRLNWALEGITEEKLQEASLKTVSQVAKDMAVVIKQMEPDEHGDSDKSTNIQVVLFSPAPMQEHEFPRIKAVE
jgi:predicted transcriptional regulator